MSSPKPLDVYLVRVRWRKSEDLRPCVVLSEPRNELVTIALVSASTGLFDRNLHFRIEEDHPNFKATGLSRASFVAGDEIREISVASLGKHVGKLEGELARRFEKWLG